PPPASPEQLLHNVLDLPEFLKIDNIVSDAESVDTSLVSPFLESDDESNDWINAAGSSITAAGSRLMLLDKVDTGAEVIVDGVVRIIAPTTAEQRLAKKNKLKARGTLLMALLDKHKLKYNIYKDAKPLMEAIEKRLQKLISELEILGETISQEDINLKFLRSLPSEWKTHTLIWRNKADLEEQSLDDFLNESITDAPSIFAASSKATVSTLPNVDSLSDAVIYSFFASQSNSP
nr:hypothetical protein [Tanacetum cinerariifolium]